MVIVGTLVADGYTASCSRDTLDAGVTILTTQQGLVIDIPGSRSQGVGRAETWGKPLLGNDYVVFHIRHEGSPLWLGSKWQQEKGTVITLPRQFDSRETQGLLKPIGDALAQGKNVYVKVDMNVTLPGYLAHTKTAELKWTAQVADTLVDMKEKTAPKAFTTVMGHSAGTDVPKYMQRLPEVNYLNMQSVRDFKSAQQLVNKLPTTPVDVITGQGDAPHWGQGLHRLTGENVRVIDLQKSGLATPLDFVRVHGRVADGSTAGDFKVTSAPGLALRSGVLGDLVKERVNQLQTTVPTTRPGGICIEVDIGPENFVSGLGKR
jgi:hypothetical protein